jgi:membrane protease YdiL (CAAX protease family)
MRETNLPYGRKYRELHDVRETRLEMAVFSLIFPPLLGYLIIYAFLFTGELILAAGAVVLFLISFFYSLNRCAFSDNQEVSRIGAALVLLNVITIVTIILPSLGNIYMDTIVLFVITLWAVFLFFRKNRSEGPFLSGSSVVIVLVLPFILAFAEAIFLGFRFWESYYRSVWIYMFIPFLALFGYLEEAIFRGAVQDSLQGVCGKSTAIVLAALLNAGFMLFWGSIMFALFAFISGVIMGMLFARTHSIIYVGTIHALQDTWLLLAILLLGIIS